MNMSIESTSENLYSTGSSNVMIYDPTKLIGCFSCGSKFCNLKELEDHICGRNKQTMVK